MPRDVAAAATTAATFVMKFVGILSLSVLLKREIVVRSKALVIVL